MLDYCVLGYPGGAIILLVLDSGDLTHALLSITGLARHLSAWSPGMLEYTPSEIKVSMIHRPYEGAHWLPPLPEDGESSEKPRFPLAAHLGGELQALAAGYLLACAVRSLHDPADPRGGPVRPDFISAEVSFGARAVIGGPAGLGVAEPSCSGAVSVYGLISNRGTRYKDASVPRQ